MIRVIVRTDEASMAANVGGAVNTTWRTFDIEAPELEAYLRENVGTYGQRQCRGVELLETVPRGDEP